MSVKRRGPFDPQAYLPSADEIGPLVMGLRRAGITDTATLKAIEEVPRRLFVDAAYADLAYKNQALPIGCEQTISSPHVVALMTQAAQLTPSAKVLEIGTGSGYQTAILSKLCQKVITVERHRDLLVMAKLRLRELRLSNVVFIHGEGTKDARAHAPFDRVLVTAAAAQVPDSLSAQLAQGGRIVLPIGEPGGRQSLSVIVKHNDGTQTRSTIADVRFVPLIIE